ncbi:DUF3040 domain-containing protein [Nonomuraea sp. NN258]|uniref:DUF3040 domain-containing protein n=1 Tax=Nonomuraea antri TaxID=2730852 RepID=UPI00156A6848|nr:DUF3040 domain-containing protein [Nonomuraea antri]NRQ37652.1 DUF3040 domain-containing protein [Nonomuraea antri]
MALSAHERAALDAIARHLGDSDPTLVRSLAEHGEGEVTAERLPSLWDGWPALIAVVLAAFSLLLLFAGSPDAAAAIR